MNPQQDASDRTFEESIKEVMQTLPPPIRAYLAGGRYSAVAKSLMTKYGLHIDQGGILEREVMLLLMGIESPQEFSDSLKQEALIPDDVVRNIVTDINQQIFIPLREEMRRSGQVAPTATAPSYGPPAPARAPQVQMPPPPAMRPAVPPQPMPPARTFAPASAPISNFHLENKLPTRPPLSEPPAPPTALPVAPTAPLPPKIALPRPPGPIFHKPLPVPALPALQQGESPPRNEPPARLPAVGAPPPNLPTGSAPISATPLLVVPPPPVHSLSSLSRPPALPFPRSAPTPLSSGAQTEVPHTRYSNDPYREPFDEV